MDVINYLMQLILIIISLYVFDHCLYGSYFKFIYQISEVSLKVISIVKNFSFARLYSHPCMIKHLYYHGISSIYKLLINLWNHFQIKIGDFYNFEPKSGPVYSFHTGCNHLLMEYLSTYLLFYYILDILNNQVYMQKITWFNICYYIGWGIYIAIITSF